MSKIKNVKINNLPTGWYVFVRFWPDWFSDSDFPFDRFNAAPDDRFAIEVEEFVKNNDECKAKLSDALTTRWSQFLRRANRRVRSSLDTTRRELEIESWAWRDIQSSAKSLGFSPDKSKPDLVKLILEAEEFKLQRDRDALRLLPQKPGRHLGGKLEDFVQRNLATASLFDYARAAGWVGRFATRAKGEMPASRRQIVWRVNERQEAERLSLALQDRFISLQPYARFGILSVAGFTAAQRITIQRNIDILCGTDPIPSHVTSKLDFPDHLRSVVQEAAKIVELLQTREHQDGNEAGTKDRSQRVGEKNTRTRVTRDRQKDFARSRDDAINHAIRTLAEKGEQITSITVSQACRGSDGKCIPPETIRGTEAWKNKDKLIKEIGEGSKFRQSYPTYETYSTDQTPLDEAIKREERGHDD